MWQHRWPSGCHKVELVAGVLVFAGEFDERDVETAQRTYPGRQIILNRGGGIEIHPDSDTPPRSIFEILTGRRSREE